MTTPWFDYLNYQQKCKEQGREDTIEGWMKKDNLDNPKTKRSIEIEYEGKMYPSISACAKEFGVSSQTISRRLGRYKK